jgi:hypothetical protein
MTHLWAKREAQIRGVIETTAGIISENFSTIASMRWRNRGPVRY